METAYWFQAGRQKRAKEEKKKADLPVAERTSLFRPGKNICLSGAAFCRKNA